MSERQHARITPEESVGGEVLVPRPLVISNISVAGVRIETPDPLPLNSIRTLRLHLAGRSVVVRGRVCHTTATADGRRMHVSGIEFLEVSDEVRAAIEAYVSTPSADVVA
jgi:hypothetical protein